MRYTLIKYGGFEVAMLGMMLSYGKTRFEDFLDYPTVRPDLSERFKPLSEALVQAGSGHDKFLEQIQYWIAIQAPLYWWKQFDTYRIGVSKSSESTMHKSLRNIYRQRKDHKLAEWKDFCAWLKTIPHGNLITFES